MPSELLNTNQGEWIMKYKKKPIIIEAWQLTKENKDQVFNNITCNKAPDWDDKGNEIIKIQTLEGVMIARLGDYIIRGIKGEFYPCKEDVFEATYELIND